MRRKRQSILGTLIFAVLFFVGGLMAYTHLTQPMAEEAEETKNWPFVEGVVTFSNLAKSENSEGKDLYAANVHYDYTVNGKTLSSRKIHLHDGTSTSKRGAKKALKKYALDTKVKVYYNPQSPENAVLEPGLEWELALLLKLPLVFCGGAVLMVLALVKRILFRR